MFYPIYGLGPYLLRWASVQALTEPRPGPGSEFMIWH